jgi:hypothetical protein
MVPDAHIHEDIVRGTHSIFETYERLFSDYLGITVYLKDDQSQVAEAASACIAAATALLQGYNQMLPSFFPHFINITGKQSIWKRANEVLLKKIDDFLGGDDAIVDLLTAIAPDEAAVERAKAEWSEAMTAYNVVRIQKLTEIANGPKAALLKSAGAFVVVLQQVFGMPLVRVQDLIPDPERTVSAS